MSDYGKIGIELIDIHKVRAFVRDLSKIDQEKAIKAGLSKGARIFMQAGKRNLKATEHGGVVTGTLMDSFTARVKRRKPGALAGFNIPGGQGSWLHDKGTVPRYTKKGQYRGVMPASYFWKRTKEESSSQAVDAVWQGMKTAVEQMKARSNAKTR